MIPLQLYLSGFLSYHDPVEIDFSTFELACITGANGAGKSSLLDAITWVLFGEARRRDDAVINAQSKIAEVRLVFTYEGNTYRVQRIKPREKSTVLEFQIAQNQERLARDNSNREQKMDPRQISLAGFTWKPLTERTYRETQEKIEAILRLNYETFVNASFFIQGKADQFTQQRPGDRKRILGTILGLDDWELYRQRSNELRKELEEEIDKLDGRLHEIAGELSEEAVRKETLSRLETELERLTQARRSQESVLENIRRIVSALTAQRNLVETLRRQSELMDRNLAELRSRLSIRQDEHTTYTSLLNNTNPIETGYAQWEQKRVDLEHWEEVASRFREQEKRREAPRLEIQATHSRLEGEIHSLQAQLQKINEDVKACDLFQSQVRELQDQVRTCELKLNRRGELELELEKKRQAQADAGVENKVLKTVMDELKERIIRLKDASGAACPVCGQPLNPDDRLSLIISLEEQGKEMGNRYRSNLILRQEVDGSVRLLQEEIASLRPAEAELRAVSSHLAQANARLEQLTRQRDDWDMTGAPRLIELELTLAQENYAHEARQLLAKIDSELKEIGYDAASHDATRKEELSGRVFETKIRDLERARAALVPLEREISDIQAQSVIQEGEAQRQRTEYCHALESLQVEENQAPDLRRAEDQLYRLHESENRLRLEVGASQQKVMVLEDLKVRSSALTSQREVLARQVSQYRQLERAFGKDGVPALLIEQAIPEIESQANQFLERLSDGEMTVRFVTQSAYKDKNRGDLKETLDIQISDRNGTRDYELYSGGEAFRVNFAVRLALSEVLAQRAGARLQTLVIDEGFGSQDILGRQRLVEAINLVRSDFAKILVITHVDELKDAFPTRIDVEKTESGSRVRILQN